MKNIFRIALSIGVSFVILALLLHALSSGLPDSDRPSVFSALQQTVWQFVFAYFLLYLVTTFIRAYRYRLLIQVSGESNVPTLKQMALVTGIRNMVVDMLPARLGELGYVGLLNRGYGVKVQHCVSSLTISIAFDLLALLVVVMLIVLKQLLGDGIEPWAIAAAFSALGLSLIALLGLFFLTPLFAKFAKQRFNLEHTPTNKLGRWFYLLLRLLDDFSQSLTTVRRSGNTVSILSLSVVIRLLKYLGFYLLFIGVAMPSFAALAELPVEQVVSALIGGELGASLPIPTFMSFGAYEAGTALVFQILGITDQASAVVTMLCVHIWSQFVEYLIGGALFAVFILINRQSKKAVSARSPRVAFMALWLPRVGAASILLGGSMFLAVELWAAKKLGAVTPPAAGQVADDAGDRQALSEQHVGALNGFVVFSSNRDGNHDIFKLNLADSSLSKITTHPHTETYPRISPDGSSVVFSRAHQPWVSQRNSVAWDVYVIDLASGQEQRVGTNGTAPQWLNNDEISYLRDATTVLRVNVNDLTERVVYQTGVGNPMPQGSHIQNPKFNPITEQLVFTGRQNQIGMNLGHWGTAITIGNKHKGLFNGCELGWTSDGSGLYQVTTGGRDNGLRIVSVNPQTFESKTLIDLAGEFSHEYWPKDSANGQYMVFGASRGPQDHEHDTKDYEIFLWKVGSDSSKATRLTFHTGNDNWPDVFIP